MKAILLLTLSAIILSQSLGFAYADHLVGHGITSGEEGVSSGGSITIMTDSTSYETGDLINISGYVPDYDESDPYKNFDVTIRLVDPISNIINFSQVPVNSDGSYSTFILAEGPLWKFDGEYTVHVNDPVNSASATFTFILSEYSEEEVTETIEVSEEELSTQCGPGTHLEDGTCVLDATTESTSGSTGFSGATGPNELAFSITFTVFIAFAIMIIFYLISRASKAKTA